MSAQKLYQHGRFVGVDGSVEHQMHYLRLAIMDAENQTERDDAEREFKALQVTAQGQAAAKRMFSEWGETWTAANDAGTARKPCAILGTDELTHIDRFKRGYVVKGLIGRAIYAEIFGAPGSGKTFIALDMAYAVAQGREWFGRKVNAGLVLYVPYQGGGGLTKRVAALVDKYGHAPNFKVIENPAYNLRELSGRQALGADIARLPEKPALIIFDTLARALGGDENSAQDMGAFNASVAALIENTGATVLIIHHSGKDTSKGARGSSALLGAIDTEIEVRDQAIISRKQRDGDNPPPFGFKLEPVALCEDEDGDPITSCTVAPSAAGARNSYKPTGQAREAFEALCKLSPNNEPVTSAAWKAAFARAAWPVNPPEAGAQRKAFQRAVKALAGARWVTEAAQGWHRPLTGGADA